MRKRDGILIVSAALFGILTPASAITVSSVQTDEAAFFAIPAGETIETYRSFHAAALEAGDNETKDIRIGDGDFLQSSSEPTDNFTWVVNTEYNFTLSYDIAGNLDFSVEGTLLEYQPLNGISQVFIANDNDAADAIIGFGQGMELTGMVFESGGDTVNLSDLITSGPSEFKGLIVSGFEEVWSLSGVISFTSDFDQLSHSSSFKFYGAVDIPQFGPIELTGYGIDPQADTVTLTWISDPAKTYTVEYTQDLAAGFTEVLDAAVPGDGSSTTYGPVANPLPGAAEVFFRVREN